MAILQSPEALKEHVGNEIGVTDWFQVTQERIRAFAEATEDRQWIHVDEDRARRESPFHSTVAHGFLTLSLFSQFIREAVQIRSGVRLAVNYGLNKARFPAPLRAGTRVRARITILSAQDVADALEATYNVVIEVEQEQKPCCVADWIVRYYK